MEGQTNLDKTVLSSPVGSIDTEYSDNQSNCKNCHSNPIIMHKYQIMYPEFSLS